MRTGFILEVRERLVPDGEWGLFKYYGEHQKVEALAYRDGGNAKHPDRWRVFPFRVEQVEVTRVELVEQDVRGELLP